MSALMVRFTTLVALAATAIGCANGLGKHNLPPAQQLAHPGPGVGGPGPGVLGYDAPQQNPIMLASGMMGHPGGPGGPGHVDPAMFAGAMGGPRPTSQLFFVGPAGTTVQWDVSQPGMFDSEPLVTPGKFNFPQGAIYRMKLTSIPGRPGVELYPTIEVAPSNPRTSAYLAHNVIPVQFTNEDLNQVKTGNFVTKVIYLPDAEFQEIAIAGVETLVSTRLDPGVDPITEADRRGSIMAIIRLGNKDLEVPGTETAAVMDGQVQPAGFGAAAGPGGPVPTSYQPVTAAAMQGPGMPGGPMPIAHMPISGVNTPEYGWITSGTPIGLQGPPHIPLGGPAGLRRHTVVNHTFNHIPHPTRKVRLDVMQSPGMSYPKPASHGFIHERNFSPGAMFINPLKNKLQQAP